MPKTSEKANKKSLEEIEMKKLGRKKAALNWRLEGTETNDKVTT